MKNLRDLDAVHGTDSSFFYLPDSNFFLLVNGGVDLRGDHTLLATGGETSDLKRQKYIEQFILGNI